MSPDEKWLKEALRRNQQEYNQIPEHLRLKPEEARRRFGL